MNERRGREGTQEEEGVEVERWDGEMTVERGSDGI